MISANASVAPELDHRSYSISQEYEHKPLLSRSSLPAHHKAEESGRPSKRELTYR